MKIRLSSRSMQNSFENSLNETLGDACDFNFDPISLQVWYRRRGGGGGRGKERGGAEGRGEGRREGWGRKEKGEGKSPSCTQEERKM